MGWAQRVTHDQRAKGIVRRRPLIEQAGLVAVVSGDRSTYPQFATCLYTLSAPRGSAVMTHVTGGGGLAHGRNELVREALRRDAAWLLFLDDDHVFPSDTLTRLLAHDVDMVQCLVCQRTPPHHAIVFRHFDVPSDATDQELAALWDHSEFLPLTPYHQGLIEVSTCGMGGTLIARRVLEAIGDSPFQWKLGTNGGEDTWFCLLARRAGFRIFVDAATPIGHLTTTAIWPTRDQLCHWTHEFSFEHTEAAFDRFRRVATMQREQRETKLE